MDIFYLKLRECFDSLNLRYSDNVLDELGVNGAERRWADEVPWRFTKMRISHNYVFSALHEMVFTDGRIIKLKTSHWTCNEAKNIPKVYAKLYLIVKPCWDKTYIEIKLFRVEFIHDRGLFSFNHSYEFTTCAYANELSLFNQKTPKSYYLFDSKSKPDSIEAMFKDLAIKIDSYLQSFTLKGL